MKTLKINAKIVVLIFMSYIVFNAYCCNKSNSSQPKWRKFYYHYWDKDNIKEDTTRQLTLSESIKVISVLTYYGVDLEIRKGSVYVPDAVYRDTMFIFSISQKSLDSRWLSTHIWAQ